MIYIENNHNDPYFNQAYEEYIFENYTFEDDVLLLWINDPCLICGKYQNIFQEVNISEAVKRNIPVIRRNTGGGTVFHDRGNLNYTIIKAKKSGPFLGYDHFIQPMIDALNLLGIPAHKKNVCDIAIDGMKISGSAQSVKKDKILHHGTLLFDSDLKSLRELLNPASGKMVSKAVKSIPSSVTNIKDYLNNQEDMDINSFKHNLKEALTGKNGFVIGEDQQFIKAVQKLSNEKYKTWDWNIGKGPKFTFYPENTDIYLCVDKGIVVQCNRAEYEGITADAVFKEL